MTRTGGGLEPAQGVQVGTPSLAAGASDVDPTKIAQVLVVDWWPTEAVQPSAVSVIVGPVTPVLGLQTVVGKPSR